LARAVYIDADKSDTNKQTLTEADRNFKRWIKLTMTIKDRQRQTKDKARTKREQDRQWMNGEQKQTQGDRREQSVTLADKYRQKITNNNQD
jgi:hypothetical protein